MIRVNSSGDFGKTRNWINKLQNREMYKILDKYGRIGVDALAEATPVESGLTAESWGYRTFSGRTRVGVVWYNDNIVDGNYVAILLQYGHATGTGGYVQGRDYINPAMQPIFDQIMADFAREVKAA